MLRPFALVAVAVLLAGCTAGTSLTSAPSRNSGGGLIPPSGALHAKRATNSGSYIYASNVGGPSAPFTGSVLIFPVGSNGNVAPSAVITGSNTLLTQVAGIVVTSTGEIYVAVSDTNTIVGFAPGSSGNATPNIVISGPNTSLASPLALAIDDADNIYVVNCNTLHFGPPGPTSVEEFTPASNGNVAPIRTIEGKRTQVGVPEGIAVDHAGQIFIANSSESTITVYGSRANGNVRPRRVISGSNSRVNVPVGVAVDGKNLFATAAYGGYIERLPRNASGDTPPRSLFYTGWPGDPSGQSLAGVATPGDGTIYVAGYSAPLIAQYATGAKGHPHPLTEITGPNTDIVLTNYLYVR
jgi:hypothetical protein